MDPQAAIDLVDENTILVVAIMGTTYTGHYEDVAKMNELLEKNNREHGRNVHIHVDAASGGFVAPFVGAGRVWDFRLSLVGSISTSGHKYGQALAGVGWAIFKNKAMLPDEILFTVNYLGEVHCSQQVFPLMLIIHLLPPRCLLRRSTSQFHAQLQQIGSFSNRANVYSLATGPIGLRASYENLDRHF